MAISLITPPYAEPLDLAEVKKACRVDIPDDDALVQRYLAAARRHAEIQLRKQIVAATWRVSLDTFRPNFNGYVFDAFRLPNPPQTLGAVPFGNIGYPYNVIHLPQPPVIAVSQIQYIDTTGATITLDPSLYLVDLFSSQFREARITPAYGTVWPWTRTQMNAVTVTLSCGYVTPFSVSTSGSTITTKGATFANDTVLRLSNSGGELPSPLQPYTDYYVVNASGATIQLAATSGGTAITIGTTGTGTSYIGVLPETIATGIMLLVGYWYRNREDAAEGAKLKIPNGFDALMNDERDWSYT